MGGDVVVVWRFNPPPGWPPAPPGFAPPSGWRPDPSWPPAPPGWPFWVDDATPPQARVPPASPSGGGSVGPYPMRPRSRRSGRPAPHVARLTAFVIDAVTVACAFGVLLLLGKVTSVVSGFDVLTFGTMLVALAACLAGVMGLTAWLTDGQSIGKAACGLVLVRVDGAPWEGSLRELAWQLARHSWGYSVIDVFGIGAAAALVTARHRCLHDLAFGSEVARLPDPSPAPVTLQQRGTEFTARLEAGLERSKIRYGWVYQVWSWLAKIITLVAKIVFGLLLLISSIPWLTRFWTAFTAMQQDAAQPVGYGATHSSVNAAPSGAAKYATWIASTLITTSLVLSYDDHPSVTTPQVPGTANLFAAGSAVVPALSGGGGTLPPSIQVEQGMSVTVTAAGSVTCTSNGPLNGPDGGTCAGSYTDVKSQGSISGTIASGRTMFLVGVFVADHSSEAAPPPRMDFSSGATGTNFLDLHPRLNQSFFIGDGRSDAQSVQRFYVPPGATRLYLGFIDAYAFLGTPGTYGDNSGVLDVAVTTSKGT